LAHASCQPLLANLGEDIGTAIALVDRALALNPRFARGWNLSGTIRILDGQHDLAIEHIETALRLSPRLGNYQTQLGRAYFLKRQFGEAAAKLLLAIQQHPGLPNPYRFLTACYAHMGRLDEARTMLSRWAPSPR
jgi:tetratricopeptide (TPR) repeat protein